MTSLIISTSVVICLTACKESFILLLFFMLFLYSVVSFLYQWNKAATMSYHRQWTSIFSWLALN